MIHLKEWIREMENQDVHFSVENGHIHINAPKGVVSDWLPYINDYKEEIINIVDDKTNNEYPRNDELHPHPQSADQILKQNALTTQYIVESAQVPEAIQSLLKAKITLGLDIETVKDSKFIDNENAGLDPHLSRIRLVQLYGGSNTVYVFDVMKLNGIRFLSSLLTKTFVSHNAVFDLKHLYHAGIYPQKIGCTMLQSNALQSGYSSLALLAKEYLGLEINKDLQTSDWSLPDLSPEQITYAAIDAFVVNRINQIQQEFLKKRNLLDVYRMMRDAMPSIVKMELNGIGFNSKAHAELVNLWAKRKNTAESDLRNIMGDTINPNSSRQLAIWFEQNLDKDTSNEWPKTPTGQYKTDAPTLSLFSHLPIVEPLKRYKDNSKRLSTYGYKFIRHINPKTQRIHANFKLGGTISGRLSCTKPNIQNPLRDIEFRELFHAPLGKKFVVADYSQIELRVAALVSNDSAMLQAYKSGEDLHCKTASAITGVSIEDVTKEQRRLAKAVNFGLLYGQGAKGLSKYAKQSYGVDLKVEQAHQAREAFFLTYPGLKDWQKTTAEFAEKTMQVKTPGGRIRDFRKEVNGYRYTESLNTPIQGGAAEVMMAALIHLDRLIIESGINAELVNVVHDEIVLEVDNQNTEQAVQIVQRAMINGMLEIFPHASTTGLVDAKIGKDWAEAK